MKYESDRMDTQHVLEEVAKRAPWINVKMDNSTRWFSCMFPVLAGLCLLGVPFLDIFHQFVELYGLIPTYGTLLLGAFMLFYQGHNLPFRRLCAPLRAYGGDEEYLLYHYRTFKVGDRLLTLVHTTHRQTFLSRLFHTFCNAYKLILPLIAGALLYFDDYPIQIDFSLAKEQEVTEVQEEEVRIIAQQEEEPAKPQPALTSQLTAIDLGLSVLWGTSNLGAATPEQSGNYYAWGALTPIDTQPDATSSAPASSRGGHQIAGGKYDAARATLGDGWRMPTSAECQELIKRCEWQPDMINGVAGVSVTGSSGECIFLPAAGYMTDGSLSGSYCYYWTGTSLDEAPTLANMLYYTDSDHGPRQALRSFDTAVPIRPVKKRPSPKS